MNNQMLLLKTMLMSTSNVNILRYSDDKKKRGLAWGNLIGFSFLYLILAVYVGFMCFGMAYFGMSDGVAAIPSVVICAVSFLFTLLKAHGLLFAYKGYDMLMSMPFTTKAVVSDRFLYMYIKNLPVTCLISFSALIGYAVGERLPAYTYVWWILLTFMLPVLPMVLAVGLSALIGGIGAGFKHKNLVLTILTFVLVIPLFFLRFFIEDVIRNDRVEELIGKSSDLFGGVGTRVPTVKWFVDAVNKGSVLSALLLIVVSVVSYEILFIIFSKFYKSINSKLSTSATSHAKVNDKDFKARSVAKSIAFKEFKRFTGSVVYTTNVGMGAVMALIFGILILFVNVESMLSSMTGVPIELDRFSPALIIPLVVYFFVGMVPTTACSMSLEGKNYWIIKSLPFDMMSVYKGKMLFNILLFMPVSVFASLTSCISLADSFIEYPVAILFSVSTTLFSTVYGMYCGAKYMQLDWDNEIQVIKQGKAVTVYLLPNMLGTMLIGGGLVFIGVFLGVLPIVMTFMSVAYLLLALASYAGVKKLAKKA